LLSIVENRFRTNKLFCFWKRLKTCFEIIKFWEKKLFLEIGERLKLQEIEKAFNHFKICPKCNSATGFWLGLKSDSAYVQCKDCGAKFELFEVYKIGERGSPLERLKFFRK